MKEQKTRFDKIIARIKNNRVLAVVIVLGTIIIAVSALTDAAQNLWSVIIKRERTCTCQYQYHRYLAKCRAASRKRPARDGLFGDAQCQSKVLVLYEET